MAAIKLLDDLIAAGDAAAVEQVAREMARRLDQIAGLRTTSHLGEPMLVRAIEPEAVFLSENLQAIHRLYVAAMAARDHIANQHLHPGGIRQRLCNQLSDAVSGVGHLFVQGEAVPIERNG